MSAIISNPKDVAFEIRPYAHEANGSGKAVAHKRAPAMSNATQRVLRLLLPIIVAGLLLLGWYLGTAYGYVPSLILPVPGDVLASLHDGLSSGLFESNALVTVQESVLGFLLAVLVASPLGYGLAKSRLLAAPVCHVGDPGSAGVALLQCLLAAGQACSYRLLSAY